MPTLRLTDTPLDHRPRERLFALGPSALTPVELLSILLGTGGIRHDALAVARGVLHLGDGTLRALARRPVAELGHVVGMGPAKAARVVAALELAKRLATESTRNEAAIRSPADVLRRCGPGMRDLTVEEFRVLTLDVQHRVTRDVLITRGILNGSLVHPREVFRVAIAEAAAGIIVVHNHPSGTPTPSPDDRAVTTQLANAGRIVDVPLSDHVIVAGDRYFSFAEAGLL